MREGRPRAAPPHPLLMSQERLTSLQSTLLLEELPAAPPSPTLNAPALQMTHTDAPTIDGSLSLADLVETLHDHAPAPRGRAPLPKPRQPRSSHGRILVPLTAVALIGAILVARQVMQTPQPVRSDTASKKISQ